MTTLLYAAPEDLQVRMDAGATYTAGETALHLEAIERVSRLIDNECDDYFGKSDSAARVFTAQASTYLEVPALVSVSALKTDEDGDLAYERTWASADYLLDPANAAGLPEPKPYREIHASYATGSNQYSFPTHQRAVQVTGVWGWPKIPALVVRYTILEALRALQFDQSPSGYVTNAQLGTFNLEPALHASTKMGLRAYKRMRIGVARAA